MEPNIASTSFLSPILLLSFTRMLSLLRCSAAKFIFRSQLLHLRIQSISPLMSPAFPVTLRTLGATFLRFIPRHLRCSPCSRSQLLVLLWRFPSSRTHADPRASHTTHVAHAIHDDPCNCSVAHAARAANTIHASHAAALDRAPDATHDTVEAANGAAHAIPLTLAAKDRNGLGKLARLCSTLVRL